METKDDIVSLLYDMLGSDYTSNPSYTSVIESVAEMYLNSITVHTDSKTKSFTKSQIIAVQLLYNRCSNRLNSYEVKYDDTSYVVRIQFEGMSSLQSEYARFNLYISNDPTSLPLFDDVVFINSIAPNSVFKILRATWNQHANDDMKETLKVLTT